MSGLWQSDRDCNADDAPCQRCYKNVHLPHDPPCPHGYVACPECGPETVCADCRKAAVLDMFATGEYDPRADPLFNHLAVDNRELADNWYGGVPNKPKEQASE